MSELRKEGELEVEPLAIGSGQREGETQAGMNENYVRILEQLEERVKKPLHSLRVMIETEIERISSQE
jgi:hypothetical protein